LIYANILKLITLVRDITVKVTKAIFPVAGLGTRFLPATKANPKEMLPIVDKPLIQYAVEEAVAAGITELIFVTSSSKRAIEDHFDSNFELEFNLLGRNKLELLSLVQNIIPEGVSCSYIRQKSPLGLGHAVLCARQLISDEPFAVLLADDLIDTKELTCLEQMVSVYNKTKNSVVAVERIPLKDTSKYGIVDINFEKSKIAKIKGVVEKPFPEYAPSNLGIVGRYILTPNILQKLENLSNNTEGEVQLTDAIAELLSEQTVDAFRFEGRRYDCGNKLGYLHATLAYGLKHPEIGEQFEELLVDFVR